MKVYLIYTTHWDDIDLNRVYLSKENAEKELERLRSLLTRTSRERGYGCYMEEAEVVDGEGWCRANDGGESK